MNTQEFQKMCFLWSFPPSSTLNSRCDWYLRQGRARTYLSIVWHHPIKVYEIFKLCHYMLFCTRSPKELGADFREWTNAIVRRATDFKQPIFPFLSRCTESKTWDLKVFLIFSHSVPIAVLQEKLYKALAVKQETGRLREKSLLCQGFQVNFQVFLGCFRMFFGNLGRTVCGEVRWTPWRSCARNYAVSCSHLAV